MGFLVCATALATVDPDSPANVIVTAVVALAALVLACFVGYWIISYLILFVQLLAYACSQAMDSARFELSMIQRRRQTKRTVLTGRKPFPKIHSAASRPDDDDEDDWVPKPYGPVSTPQGFLTLPRSREDYELDLHKFIGGREANISRYRDHIKGAQQKHLERKAAFYGLPKSRVIATRRVNFFIRRKLERVLDPTGNAYLLKTPGRANCWVQSADPKFPNTEFRLYVGAARVATLDEFAGGPLREIVDYQASIERWEKDIALLRRLLKQLHDEDAAIEKQKADAIARRRAEIAMRVSLLPLLRWLWGLIDPLIADLPTEWAPLALVGLAYANVVNYPSPMAAQRFNPREQKWETTGKHVESARGVFLNGAISSRRLVEEPLIIGSSELRSIEKGDLVIVILDASSAVLYLSNPLKNETYNAFGDDEEMMAYIAKLEPILSALYDKAISGSGGASGGPI